MTAMTRTKAAIGGVVIGLALLAHSGGGLLAQESTATPSASSMGGMSMMGGTPAAGQSQMAQQMEQMMADCMNMMQMMQSMMGMMGMDGAATPASGQ